MNTAQYWIEQLDMVAHPEGGYYKESFKAEEEIKSADIAENSDGNRHLWTSIYFLIEKGDASHFHRLKSDEMWYYHGGSPLDIYMITPQGELKVEKLGLNIGAGEKPQILVPKNTIFGSALDDNPFSLVGCMVSPGFDFRDFELFERKHLLEEYPEYGQVISKLTR